MRSYENFTPAKIKASFEIYWNRLEDWFRRRWLGLALLAVVGWLVTHKDISINFSMEKGEGGFFTTSSTSLFYDPFEDDVVQAQNVSMHADRKTANLTPEQLEKRRKQLAYVRQYHELAEHEMEKNGKTMETHYFSDNIRSRRWVRIIQSLEFVQTKPTV